jgi:membrane protease YdiL (CAAX protease family)
VLIYALSLVLIIGLPRLLKKDRTNLKELGLQRLMSWSDIGMAPVGFIVYFILTIVFIYATTLLFPDFNANQAQEIGFGNLTRPLELIFAFITLVLLAPFAEEMLFRGYLFGKLRRTLPFFMATLLTSVLFGLLHVSNGTWNVAVDVFALSLVLCYVRESTGSIWTGILIHMMKNGIAYYFLFIKPLLFHTIGG